uniref:S n=1 Tax=Myotis bat alphacoronavirus TaxID=3027593 RepID=A0AAT9T664_9ALPC|nr:MAG: S [Myotis bat alphacoronavirus] [Myotis bat alphacoronavirus]
MILFLLAFVTVINANAINETGYHCTGTTNLQRFFSKFEVVAPAIVVVGGYLPNSTGQWYCRKSGSSAIVAHTDVHGIFMSYNSGRQGFVIGISQAVFQPDNYQFYMFKANQENVATLRICKWSTQLELTYGKPITFKGHDCLFNSVISFNMEDSAHILMGVTWVGDRVNVFADKLYSFTLPNSNWSLVKAGCTHYDSCAFQFPKTQLYYNLNVTGPNVSDISYAACDSPDCQGIADNVFSVEEDGRIPADFSFNNWFLLTNSSTLVSGTIVSSQPMRLSCLWPVPRFQGVSSTIWFNGSNEAVCNGYHANLTADVLRFNLNGTDSPFMSKARSIILNTAMGVVEFFCSNSSTPGHRSIPFGNVGVPYYCFSNGSFVVDNEPTFIGILPPTMREIVIDRRGAIYINGYNYFQTPPIYGVNFDISSQDSAGFWTVAFASWTDVMVQVNGTNIQRMLYCDSPDDIIRCSQLNFDLQDGFYPLTSQNPRAESQPTAFVTLPAFNNHKHVNIEVNFTFGGNYDTLTVVSVRIGDGNKTYCVDSNQFTLHFKPRDTNGAYVDYTYRTLCPFDLYSINNYLTFGRICFSTVNTQSGCPITVYAKRSVWTNTLITIYVTTTPGDQIAAVPKPLGGVTDVSFFQEGVCSKYTIYGFKGEGIIRKTDDTFDAGLYYTSTSGQLLAFKNVTTSDVYSVTPCQFSQQAAFVGGHIVGVMSSINSTDFNKTITAPGFYYHTDGGSCSEPVLVYSNIGICKDGGAKLIDVKQSNPNIAPMMVGNVSIPTNFTMSIRTEYIQLFNNPVSIDCAMYVCNGNERCLRLLAQYTSACQTIESALSLSARLESLEVNSMITVSDTALALANISTFNGGGYNFSTVLGASMYGGRSFIEDMLFDKVVTTGLGTVDQDYKKCSNGLSVADLACAQYYNGIMVLPGVADAEKLHMYSASLVGGMALGGFTSAASLPFSYAVQARLNYVALQTDVLQRNQQILAESFNNAISNITEAFSNVNDAIAHTAEGLSTVAQALTKVQDVVNTQGLALSHLTKQLQNNFQAISSSISDIYDRLDELTANAQVDRLINGRLAALNAFVSQSLTKYTEVQASRKLAQQKVNECVKSQSQRYGFCGDDGDHVFSIVQAAPQGLMFLHTVLVPSEYAEVVAVAGLCVDATIALVVRQPALVLFTYSDGDDYYISSRRMFEPRSPQLSDFVRIESCDVTYHNLSSEQLPNVVPDYIDVNKTLEDILSSLQNQSKPEFPLDVFNNTYLNLTGEIADLESRSEALHNTSLELRRLIDNINSTLVDLEWLNRVETYIKWPWWVWLIIVVVLIFVVSLLVFCCISTGCCGCCGCCGACFAGCCKGPKLQPYETIEKVHIQ